MERVYNQFGRALFPERSTGHRGLSQRAIGEAAGSDADCHEAARATATV